MPRAGGCLCGAVRFSAAELGRFGVCHCRQCQRWLGAAMFAVTVPEAAMTVEGGEHVATYRSSAWASRSWCTRCGTSLWYRHDQGRDGTGDYEIPLGTLDDPNGLTLAHEIFHDLKPDSFEIAGDHPRRSEAETLALHGPQSEGA